MNILYIYLHLTCFLKHPFISCDPPFFCFNNNFLSAKTSLFFTIKVMIIDVKDQGTCLYNLDNSIFTTTIYLLQLLSLILKGQKDPWMLFNAKHSVIYKKNKNSFPCKPIAYFSRLCI